MFIVPTVTEFTRLIIATLASAMIIPSAIYTRFSLAVPASSQPAAAMYLIPLNIVMVVASTISILSRNLVNLTIRGGLFCNTLLLKACISQSPPIVLQKALIADC